LENWLAVIGTLQGCLNHWSGLLAKVPSELLLALAVLPVALALVSRRWAIVIVCIVFSFAAFFVLISPQNAVVILATAFYLGSLVMAVSCIIARQKAKSFEVDFTTLRLHVRDLLESDQRRLLRDIRSPSKDRDGKLLRQPSEP
jgi:uncharacterized membrane protein YccC